MLKKVRFYAYKTQTQDWVSRLIEYYFSLPHKFMGQDSPAKVRNARKITSPFIDIVRFEVIVL